VSHALATDEAAAVKGFSRALFRGLRENIADPDAAIAALSKRDPSIATLGPGAIDPARLAKSIDIVVAASGLPRTPAAGEIFNPAFLPPLADRPLKLS
jgi:NitT/TauT family transport system substrate-binding protein